MAEIEKYKVIRWILYIAMMINSYMLHQNISNNLRFTIAKKVWCPAFGANMRCDEAIIFSIVGMFSGLGLFLLGVFETDEKTKKLKFFHDNEPSLCLIQVPLWIGLFFEILSWTKEEETAAFEINCIYVCIALNIILLIGSAIVSYIEKEVKNSREN
mmetsp:Transcript_26601/g.51848  ORF Transcript_26601/g.51848 Transcript_26601/m.51848 type:complete len:157 (-) Transcript_26601:47-517(-)